MVGQPVSSEIASPREITAFLLHHHPIKAHNPREAIQPTTTRSPAARADGGLTFLPGISCPHGRRDAFSRRNHGQQTGPIFAGQLQPGSICRPTGPDRHR